MMMPIDTALLKHQPDHRRPLTEADRIAERLATTTRPTFRVYVTQVFALVPRSVPSSAEAATFSATGRSVFTPPLTDM